MARLTIVEPEQTEGKTRELLDAVQNKYGMVPNVVKGFANSPAVLEAYINFSSAMGNASLDPKLREQVALTVAEANQCNYCLAAHSAMGKSAGLSDDAMLDARQAQASDSKEHAALRFARRVVEQRGFVSGQDLDDVRKAGWEDAQIVEIIGLVILNMFTNYFNHVAETPLDFPKVEELADANR